MPVRCAARTSRSGHLGRIQHRAGRPRHGGRTGTRRPWCSRLQHLDVEPAAIASSSSGPSRAAKRYMTSATSRSCLCCGALLGQSGEGALESVGMQVEHPGDRGALEPDGAGRGRIRRHCVKDTALVHVEPYVFCPAAGQQRSRRRTRSCKNFRGARAALAHHRWQGSIPKPYASSAGRWTLHSTKSAGFPVSSALPLLQAERARRMAGDAASTSSRQPEERHAMFIASSSEAREPPGCSRSPRPSARRARATLDRRQLRLGSA